MTKIVLKKESSAIFLAIVLVLGTISLTVPSFMVGAQAAPYPDIDRENKVDKKSVSVSSLKCNNINVNINGLELNVLPPFLDNSGLAAEAVEDNTDPSSFANDWGSEINDFRFICINNNNNTVSEGEEPIPPTPPVEDECEECFRINSTLQAIVEDFLIDNTADFAFAVDSETLSIPGEVDTIEQLCPLLEGHTGDLVDFLITVFVDQQTGSTSDFAAEIDALVDCLVEAGVISETVAG